MKAKVSEKTKLLFAQGYKTIIDNKQVSVSLKDFLENPKKYAKTGIGFMYENQQDLIAYFEKNNKENEPVVLDMEQAKRGKTFDKKAKQNVSNEIATMLEEQIKRRKRVAERFERNKKLAESGDEKTAAENTEKVEATAKKVTTEVNTKAAADTEAKAKAEAEAKAAAAAKANSAKK